MLVNILWAFTQVYEKMIDLAVPIKFLFHNLLCNELNWRFSFIVSKSASSKWFTCQVNIQCWWEGQIKDAFSMARVIFYILKMKGILNRLNYLNLTNYASIAKEASLDTSFLIVMTIYINCWFQIKTNFDILVKFKYISLRLQLKYYLLAVNMCKLFFTLMR